MMQVMLDNWITLIGLLSAPIVGVFGYIFGGRKRLNLELERSNVSIKKDNSDAVSSMQEVYNKFLEDYKERMNDVSNELKEVKANNKSIQNQFNEIQLAYAKEVEQRLHWEKSHNELRIKYNILEKEYETLKAFCENLKKMVDKNSKTNAVTRKI